MGDTVSKTITISSTFDSIERLEPFLTELRQEIGFGDDRFAQIRLALNESITNAITHGNKEDPSKKIFITATADGDRLQISVKDEGTGFNPETLDDPLKEENLLKDSGRGIFLIKQNADEVVFSENATKLTMSFELDAK